ncbi:hypothetical protein TSACC_315 [Terrimicrobium sacchariphilum]|uniref:Uncharacterized protein n=1 Tax=Terrimicrobium sacchariphilum TaxID=690879 RepID=A0A146GEQ0_TERSA|nr:hypothetical protein [Terrimicrobium sacchariphilum]GAT34956.1 hypothetical protein TSACC_315 [Terrimicrobium sacchariphilum]
MLIAGSLALLCLAGLSGQAADRTLGPTSVSLNEFQLMLGDFARQYLQDIDEQPIEAGTVLAAAMKSETLENYPYIRQQTLAILRELTSLPGAKTKAAAEVGAVRAADKPISSLLPDNEWVAEEKDRRKENFAARRRSAEKTISNCLNILQQISQTQRGQQFALLGSDPLLEAMRKAAEKNKKEE